MSEQGDRRNGLRKDAEATAQQVGQALQQPGIRELMAVYEDWKPYEAAARPHSKLRGVQRIISLSDSSVPAVKKGR